MKSKKAKKERPSIRPSHHGGEAVAIVSGAVAGAATGAIAGPPGMLVGGALGGVGAAIATAVIENAEHDKAVHEEAIDKDIGVIDGQMGAGHPDDPPARIGAFSAGSAGASRPSKPPAEGIMPSTEKEG